MTQYLLTDTFLERGLNAAAWAEFSTAIEFQILGRYLGLDYLSSQNQMSHHISAYAEA